MKKQKELRSGTQTAEYPKWAYGVLCKNADELTKAKAIKATNKNN